MIERIRDAVAWRWWYLRTPFARGVLSRLPWYPKVFLSWRDGLNYARSMLTITGGGLETAVCVKALDGKPLSCRPGTSDPWVLWDVFHHQFQQLPPEIDRPACIVDLGANVDYTAAYYAAAYPTAQIVAVEMDRANYDLACRNTDAFGNRCQVIHAAVWDHDGELEYSGREQQGYRAIGIDASKTDGNICSVAARGLSSLFEELGLRQIDFLKMDIEGAEAVVFRGPLDWLKIVRALKIELHSPMTIKECAEILRAQGFACRKDIRHNQCLVAIRSIESESNQSQSNAEYSRLPASVVADRSQK